nr:MAG TPA: hypothetical protein [Caudoviricetes sp.]
MNKARVCLDTRHAPFGACFLEKEKLIFFLYKKKYTFLLIFV